jgi:hypothetical protein
MDIVELDQSTGAICLDGSNYKFQLMKGFGEGKNNFIIYLQGGSWCGDDGSPFIESCVKRSKSNLGSSSDFKYSKHYFISRVRKMFSSNSEYNPDFFNWNKVLLKYCDGSGHQGYLNDPLKIEDNILYFRGFNNTMESIKYLQKHLDLLNANKIILSGSSAGGLSAFYWTNYLNNYLKKQGSSAKLLTISDSSVFLDVYRRDTQSYFYRNIMINLMKNLNPKNISNEFYDSYCRYKEDELYKCLLPQYFVKDILTPVFVIFPQYDIATLKVILGKQCIISDNYLDNCSEEDKKDIEQYREDVIAYVNDLSQSKYNWGFWLSSCFTHTYLYFSRSLDNIDYAIKNQTLMKSISYWYNNVYTLNNSYVLIDEKWPLNQRCAYQKDFYFYYNQYRSILKEWI